MGRTLLIVDDVESNRKILKTILDSEYDILEAANGAEALDVLREHDGQVSAVLLDIIMPVMDGFQVLEHMRADEKLKHIPVVVATAKNEDESEVKAFIMGASDYISKPYRPLIIRQRLKNIINLH